jgi:hypothetical protein
VNAAAEVLGSGDERLGHRRIDQAIDALRQTTLESLRALN